ncbi:hypothetical protein J2741_000810 [Methanolinea mesophila]|uniref:YIP1 family protein n=1 Tax=Methanolinea mesophila TaxID=547055 RepID=UPI001AE87438|nr:YIP1 family protein [Methanolinea mesophila]MBP1928263.1 hypothetical protein [Methanolinea mesophila]
MTHSIPAKIVGFLFHPAESFREVKDEDINPTLKYFGAIAFFYALLFTIMTTLELIPLHPIVTAFGVSPEGGLVGALLFVLVLIIVFAMTFIFAFLFGAWLHLFAWLLGGRKGLMQTEKSTFYGLTPLLIIGWIPVIGGIIGGIWSLVLEIIGLKELQGISTVKAAVAVILAIVIAFIIIAALFGAVFMAAVSQGITTQPLV